LYSQPEKTRWNWPCGLRTSSWTKAPVSCCTSQGAVVSQARSRTITSPTRTVWPGRKVRSRVSPVRLLSRPSTATRCAIGVVPGGSRVTVCGISTVWISSLPSAFWTGAPVGPQAASAASAAHSAKIRRRAIAQSGVHA